MSRWIAYAVVMVVTLSGGSTVAAQMGADGKGKPGMMDDGMVGGMGMPMMGGHEGMGMEMGGMGEMRKMMQAMSTLNLTPDQRKKVRLATLAHQKEAIPLLGQIRLAGVEIQELLLADPVNLDKVRTKVKEKYDAASKLEMSHLALTQEVKKILPPEQRQQMESMMMRMGSMMENMPMMRGMMGSASGTAKTAPTPSDAQTGSGEGAPESKDPHGH